MSTTLERDESTRPDLFEWNGPIPASRLNEWLQQRGLDVPAELIELWQRTGGGELLESETLLGPFGDPQRGDDVDSSNEAHRRKGLRPGYLVVHVGYALTAIRLNDRKWVTLDPKTYEEAAEHASLDDWYTSVLHAEFADRYGLSNS